VVIIEVEEETVTANVNFNKILSPPTLSSTANPSALLLDGIRTTRWSRWSRWIGGEAIAAVIAGGP